jgi:hypothetical protein
MALSIESEYMAMYACIKVSKSWCSGGVLRVDSALVCESTPLFVDNESASAIAENLVHHKGRKHIKIKCRS